MSPTTSPSTSPNAAQLISQGRNLALGFATLSILLFHQPFVANSPFFNPFLFYGYWGVELFLFLSGFGIYHSLSKTGPSHLWVFYRKRLIRILPPAMLAGCCLTLCNPFFEGVLVSGRLPYGLTPIACMLGVHLWYIRAVLIFYLLSPLLFRLLSRPIQLISAIFLSWGIGLLTYSYFASEGNHLIFYSIVSPALRFPCYIFGMVVADFYASPGRKLHPQNSHLVVLLLLGLACLAAAVHWQQGVYQFIFLPPAAAAICMVFGIFRRASFTHPFSAHLHNTICTMTEWIGKRSLEFYLLHLGVFRAIIYLHPEPQPLLLLLALVIVLLLVLPLHVVAERISSALSPKPRVRTTMPSDAPRLP